MIHRPQINPSFRWALIPPDEVVLQSERGPAFLRGSVYFLVTPLLNGQFTVDEIVAYLHEQVSADEVRSALSLLHQRGYVGDVDSFVSSEQAIFWESLGAVSYTHLTLPTNREV